ncbi:PAS domain-containing protein [Streptomyces sp. NPDC059909]|uniref:PAS domain-containing protein n=1 Tax=Streptomyces sp. NPDC059909 TaxID=3346998 RepID=UPI003652AB4E
MRDTELCCTWVNDTQGLKDGIPLQGRLGRTLTEAAPGPETKTLEALMQQVLEGGVPAIHMEYRAFQPIHGRGKPTLAASLFRHDDAHGRALGLCAVSMDVTDSERARERLAILGEAGKNIGTTLDVLRTGQELADLAVPPPADFVTVDLAEPVPLGEEPVDQVVSGSVPTAPAERSDWPSAPVRMRG